MNLLLCIGCDNYTRITPLTGAEQDARNIFRLLTEKGDHYQPHLSRLLLSPTISSIVSSLIELSSSCQTIDVLTFFFAGHGSVKAGSFYLCTKDSDLERLSLTAYPIASLFQSINELQPRQVNMVIDACEAGGSSFEIGNLCKPETIGRSNSSSIAFLGACGADEYAMETQAGGVLTTELLKCLTGHHNLGTTAPFIDLMDIGTFLSPKIRASNERQRPIFWGLSLYGKGSFARNPHMSINASEAAFSIQSVLPSSVVGQKLKQFSQELWDEYRAIKNDPSPRRLLTLLDTLCSDLPDSREKIVATVSLTETLSVRAQDSLETMAPSHCFATGAVSLLHGIDAHEARKGVQDLLRLMAVEDKRIRATVQNAIAQRAESLLSNVGVAAELFYLPLRISALLGWLGATILIQKLLPAIICDSIDECRALARSLLDLYNDSITCVSDEQAAPLYVFVEACILIGECELAKDVVNRYFASFAEKKGNIARPETDGKHAFRYIASLTNSEFVPSDWRPANPSQLLPVLMICGAKCGLSEDWTLEALDRQSSAFFLPHDYRHFGRKVIEGGQNHTHRLGFGVWHVSEFQNEFDRAIEAHFSAHPMTLPPEGIALSILASLLFPDRVPFLLERVAIHQQ